MTGISGEIKLKKITKELILEYAAKYDRTEGTALADAAMKKLFTAFPDNIDMKDILLKVAAVDNFYSTHLFGSIAMAKHIKELRVDTYIRKGGTQIVDSIASITKAGKTRHCYSFATKYCSWHNPDMYPIFDRYVEISLLHYERGTHFAKFKKSELRRYSVFKQVIEGLKKYYGLENINFKELDKFLWLYGKEIIKTKEKY